MRAVSHHNAMHGRDVAWQSAFSAARPEGMECDREGSPQLGVLALAWPEVRRHFVERFTGWVRESDFDGLFVARQWNQQDDAEERRLSDLPGVSGLVFSTFPHDNPAAVRRNDWRLLVVRWTGVLGVRRAQLKVTNYCASRRRVITKCGPVCGTRNSSPTTAKPSFV